MLSAVKAKCRKCGREVKSDEFVLDPVYKMMVCRECVKERRMNEATAQKSKVQEAKVQEKMAQEAQVKKTQPAGWDFEDQEIERAYKQKMGQMARVEQVDNEKVKYTCPKCSYQFIYNTLEQRPPRCPYCSTPVKY